MENGDRASYPWDPTEKVTEMLADQLITRQEYEDAFGDFQACMVTQGHELHFVDTSARIIDYSTSGVSDADYERCYETHFRPVDVWWQTVEQAESDQSAWVEDWFECLEETDLDLPERLAPPPGREQALLLRQLEELFVDAMVGGVLTQDQVQACIQ